MYFFIVRNIEMVNYYRIKLFTNSIYFIHGSFALTILCNNSLNIFRCICVLVFKGTDFLIQEQWDLGTYALVLCFQMGAKYDPQAEAEVRHWFKQLLNEDIGEGSMTVEKNLKDGILLIKYDVTI